MQNSGKRLRFSSTLRVGALVLGFLLVTGPAIAETKAELPTVQMISSVQRTELEGILTEKLQQYASKKPYYSQRGAGPLSVKLDAQTGLVVMDLGPQFGPDSDTGDSEQLQQELGETARSVLERNRIEYRGTDFLFGGKDYYYYHPERWHPPVTKQPPQRSTPNNDSAAIQATGPTLVYRPATVFSEI